MIFFSSLPLFVVGYAIASEQSDQTATVGHTGSPSGHGRVSQSVHNYPYQSSSDGHIINTENIDNSSLEGLRYSRKMRSSTSASELAVNDGTVVEKVNSVERNSKPSTMEDGNYIDTVDLYDLGVDIDSIAETITDSELLGKKKKQKYTAAETCVEETCPVKVVTTRVEKKYQTPSFTCNRSDQTLKGDECCREVYRPPKYTCSSGKPPVYVNGTPACKHFVNGEWYCESGILEGNQCVQYVNREPEMTCPRGSYSTSTGCVVEIPAEPDWICEALIDQNGNVGPRPKLDIEAQTCTSYLKHNVMSVCPPDMINSGKKCFMEVMKDRKDGLWSRVSRTVDNVSSSLIDSILPPGRRLAEVEALSNEPETIVENAFLSAYSGGVEGDAVKSNSSVPSTVTSTDSSSPYVIIPYYEHLEDYDSYQSEIDNNGSVRYYFTYSSQYDSFFDARGSAVKRSLRERKRKDVYDASLSEVSPMTYSGMVPMHHHNEQAMAGGYIHPNEIQGASEFSHSDYVDDLSGQAAGMAYFPLDQFGSQNLYGNVPSQHNNNMMNMPMPMMHQMPMAHQGMPSNNYPVRDSWSSIPLGGGNRDTELLGKKPGPGSAGYIPDFGPSQSLSNSAQGTAPPSPLATVYNTPLPGQIVRKGSGKYTQLTSKKVEKYLTKYDRVDPNTGNQTPQEAPCGYPIVEVPITQMIQAVQIPQDVIVAPPAPPSTATRSWYKIITQPAHKVCPGESVMKKDVCISTEVRPAKPRCPPGTRQLSEDSVDCVTEKSVPSHLSCEKGKLVCRTTGPISADAPAAFESETHVEALSVPKESHRETRERPTRERRNRNLNEDNDLSGLGCGGGDCGCTGGSCATGEVVITGPIMSQVTAYHTVNSPVSTMVFGQECICEDKNVTSAQLICPSYTEESNGKCVAYKKPIKSCSAGRHCEDRNICVEDVCEPAQCNMACNSGCSCGCHEDCLSVCP